MVETCLLVCALAALGAALFLSLDRERRVRRVAEKLRMVHDHFRLCGACERDLRDSPVIDGERMTLDAMREAVRHLRPLDILGAAAGVFLARWISGRQESPVLPNAEGPE